MIDSNIAIYTASEAVFVILLILIFWIATLRKMNKKQIIQIDTLKKNILSLKNQPMFNEGSESELPSKNTAKGPTSTELNTVKVLKIKLKKMQQELFLNKQNLSNMQQYKELYFKLEESQNNQENGNTPNSENRVHVLEQTLSEQEQLINDMKEQLKIQTDNGTEKYITQLERTIEQLEHSNGSLKTEIEKQENELAIAEKKNKERHQYRKKAQALQTTEKRLNAQVIGLKTELYKATEEIGKNTDKLIKYKQLKNTLNEKENEIQHLKNECETLGAQYHDLATKSLENINPDMSKEKKEEIESLRSILKETLEELERKHAECEMLEKNYLSHEYSGDEAFEKKAIELESSLADRTALEKAAGWLSERAVELNESGATSELKELKTLLKDKSKSLSKSKNEQEAIENKLLHLSNTATTEPDTALESLQIQHCELKEKYEKLKLINEKLKGKMLAFSKLQEDHNRLEKRYLAMARNAISR